MVPAYSMLGKSVLQRCTSIPVVVCFLSGTLLIFNNGSCIFNVYVVVVSAFPLLCYFSMFFVFSCFSLSSGQWFSWVLFMSLKTKQYWAICNFFSSLLDLLGRFPCSCIVSYSIC